MKYESFSLACSVVAMFLYGFSYYPRDGLWFNRLRMLSGIVTKINSFNVYQAVANIQKLWLLAIPY